MSSSTPTTYAPPLRAAATVSSKGAGTCAQCNYKRVCWAHVGCGLVESAQWPSSPDQPPAKKAKKTPAAKTKTKKKGGKRPAAERLF